MEDANEISGPNLNGRIKSIGNKRIRVGLGGGLSTGKAGGFRPAAFKPPTFKAPQPPAPKVATLPIEQPPDPPVAVLPIEQPPEPSTSKAPEMTPPKSTTQPSSEGSEPSATKMSRGFKFKVPQRLPVEGSRKETPPKAQSSPPTDVIPKNLPPKPEREEVGDLSSCSSDESSPSVEEITDETGTEEKVEAKGSDTEDLVLLQDADNTETTNEELGVLVNPIDIPLFDNDDDDDDENTSAPMAKEDVPPSSPSSRDSLLAQEDISNIWDDEQPLIIQRPKDPPIVATKPSMQPTPKLLANKNPLGTKVREIFYPANPGARKEKMQEDPASDEEVEDLSVVVARSRLNEESRYFNRDSGKFFASFLKLSRLLNCFFRHTPLLCPYATYLVGYRTCETDRNSFPTTR
jgi:hypothetical protein